jgi:hypothetical protein
VSPSGAPLVFLFAHRTGVRLAEIAFLLLVIGGIWLAAAQASWFGLKRARTAVSGIAFALAGVLLIVAAHWGGFG